jgi:2-polyprenyl-6-methoxyphenol hydroxylase-like FAD-dependent oxidoreductase
MAFGGCIVILIVGGGIAGLALGASLTQRGIGCELIEREPIWTTTGAGITLYPNGIRALGSLGLADAVRNTGFPLDLVRTLNMRGELVTESPGESWPGIGPSVGIHRPELQAILVEAASRVNIRLGVKLERILPQANPTDPIVVEFSDGRTGHYEVVVGADGIRSSVRNACFTHSPPRYVGQTYWRGAISKRVVEQATLQMSPNRFVVLLPLNDDILYVAAQLHTKEPPPALPPDQWLTGLLEAFDDFDGPAREAFAELGEDLHFGGAQEIDRDEWRSGRVILIGDAAHACSPILAQGGSLAIEDAVVLADRLARAGLAEASSTTRPEPQTIDRALNEFVRRREPRTRWIRESTHRVIELTNRGASATDLTSSRAEVSTFLRRAI